MQKNLKGLTVFFIVCGILLGCSKKSNSGSNNGVVATNYQLSPEYTFLVGGAYDIIFEQEGLKSGDKIRLVSKESEIVTNINIDILSDGEAKIKLPDNFVAGDYEVYFFRAVSVQNVILQKAGEMTINIEGPKGLDNNVVAHRGGSKEAGLPDNSIASLNYAISLGCYAAECDIYVTKDDSVVVCHTESSSDAIFGGKVIYNSTYAELKAAKKLSNGESLPLLRDYIKEVKKSPFTKLWLDIKSIGDNTTDNNQTSAQAGIKAAEIIKTMGVQSRVEYIVGRKSVLDACISAVEGEWNVGYMNSGYTPSQFVNAGLDWANFDLSKAFYNDPSSINAYKDKGIKVSVYNADTDAQMDFFIAEDMYAVCTNYPQKLLTKIRKQ